MIHSARPIVTPVANIVFCCFVFLHLKSGDGRTTCGRDFGLAEWIKITAVTVGYPSGSLLTRVSCISLVSFSDMEVQWILLASCLQGIFGSFTSLLTGVLAYIGTVTSQQERTSRMSLLMAMSFVAGKISFNEEENKNKTGVINDPLGQPTVPVFNVCFFTGTAGPFLSGLLASKVSHLFVFISISVCHATAILYTMFFVKEIKTERDNEKKKITLARIVSLDHLVSSMQTCFFQREQEEKKKIAILFTMAFFVMTITAGGKQRGWC